MGRRRPIDFGGGGHRRGLISCKTDLDEVYPFDLRHGETCASRCCAGSRCATRGPAGGRHHGLVCPRAEPVPTCGSGKRTERWVQDPVDLRRRPCPHHQWRARDNGGECGRADGPQEFLKAARTSRAGADHMKIFIPAGSATPARTSRRSR